MRTCGNPEFIKSHFLFILEIKATKLTLIVFFLPIILEISLPDFKFALDFQAPTVNVPVLATKTFEITNEFSLVFWVRLHRSTKEEPSHVFTILVSGEKKPPVIKCYISKKESIFLRFKGMIRSKMIGEKLNWKHFAITVNQTGNDASFKFYINGKVEKINNKPNISITELPPGEKYKGIVLGNNAYKDIIHDKNQFLNGQLTDLFLFNTVLSDQAIQNIYKYRLMPNKKYRILSWDEFSGKADGKDVKTIDYPPIY